MRRRAVAVLLLAVGCGRNAAPVAIADPTPGAAVESASSSKRPVLPIVSGCGCAYACAHAIRANGDAWDVTHDLLDSTTVRAAIERWCFDARGHGYPEKGAPVEATLCLEVFHDGTPCGGECIPTTQHLRCAAKN